MLDEDDEIYKAENGKGKSLEEYIKSRTEPVRSKIFFQGLVFIKCG
jgi:hypothetical protein